MRSLLERHTWQRTLDEQRKAADVSQALRRHIDLDELD